MDRAQEYYSLVKLPYKIIRTRNDLYYPIVNPNVIRRDFSFREDKIIQQSVILDVGETLLISKIHIQPSHPKIIKLEISEKLNKDSFITLESELEVIGGKLRVVNLGSLPCRYLKITYLKGCPIMDYNTVELYGMHVEDIQAKLTEDAKNILYEKSYNFIYNS
jgi:hypothetical protein